MCVDCDSKKSNFLKQVKNKTCIFIVKNVTKHTSNTFSKKNIDDFKKQNQRKVKMCYLFD